VSTWLWILVAVVVVIVAIAIVTALVGRRRTAVLQEGFGPEYDRTIDRAGSRGRAEADLRDRQRAHDELELKPLAPMARQGYVDAWKGTQAEFVDDPAGALDEADRLIQSVMRDRGYPVEELDVEERADLASVEHPVVIERYRRAHAVAVTPDPSTESLRRAMQDYRSLFAELVGAPDEAR
jgi:hypothetical protein